MRKRCRKMNRRKKTFRGEKQSGLSIGFPSLKIVVDPSRSFSPFCDCPDNQGGTSLGVSSCKHPVYIGHKMFVNSHITPVIIL
jgi:hypothetical protein